MECSCQIVEGFVRICIECNTSVEFVGVFVGKVILVVFIFCIDFYICLVDEMT